jgi:hypothetical protein
MALTHIHHITPKHAGGSDDLSNLIELTIEDHAIAHKVLYGLYGRWQDNLAWKMLSGRIGCEEGIREAQRLGQLGRKFTIEQKEACRKRNLGKKLSESTITKLKAFRHSDETKANMKLHHAFKNGRPGHSERMSGERNPGIIYRGKSWTIDPISNKRIWTEKRI